MTKEIFTVTDKTGQPHNFDVSEINFMLANDEDDYLIINLEKIEFPPDDSVLVVFSGFMAKYPGYYFTQEIKFFCEALIKLPRLYSVSQDIANNRLLLNGLLSLPFDTADNLKAEYARLMDAWSKFGVNLE
jgi:hypothetical protein